MNSDSPILDPGSTLSRRRFIQGIVAATVLGATGLWRRPALAVVVPDRQPEPRGTEFDLELVALPVNFTSRAKKPWRPRSTVLYLHRFCVCAKATG